MKNVLLPSAGTLSMLFSLQSRLISVIGRSSACRFSGFVPPRHTRLLILTSGKLSGPR